MSRSSAPTPTSLRIAPADRRRIAAAARRRGLSTQKFIIDAALRETSQTRTADEQLAQELAAVTRRHLARIEAAEDAEDSRLGDTAWEKYKSGKSRLLTREEFLRGVDLQDS